MSRKAEALTQILVDTRIRELKAKTSADTKGIVDHFTFALSPISCTTKTVKATNLHAKLITLGIGIDLFNENEDNAFASVKIVVDSKAAITIDGNADIKLYNELLKTVASSSYEFARNKISSLLYNMDIEDTVLPAVDQRKLVSLFQKIEKENEKEEQ